LTSPATAYLYPAYADSFAEFGVPRSLSRSGGWILERRISGSTAQDAMGCYPLFVCRDWTGLHADLDDLGESLVSLCVVADPFGAYRPADLRECFPDLVRPFKRHFVVDLTRPLKSAVSPHHRYYTTRGLREVTVQACEMPLRWLTTWVELYERLAEHRGIRGIQRFSRDAFACQLRAPGLTMLRAEHHNEVVGMSLWDVQGDVAYYHLSACSGVGYSVNGMVRDAGGVLQPRAESEETSLAGGARACWVGPAAC